VTGLADTVVTVAITGGVPAIVLLLWRLGTKLGALVATVNDHGRRLSKLEEREATAC